MSDSTDDPWPHLPEPNVAWLSRGFEALEKRCAEGKATGPHFDVVVVGSGYGGSVAASELAGLGTGAGPLRVCVLERGLEYLSGMFPSRMADLAGHVRFASGNASKPRGQLDGLFDVRVGPDLNAVVASGLGGGSLINAGVMKEAVAQVFDDRWPKVLQDGVELQVHYARALSLLGTSGEGAGHAFAPFAPSMKGEALRGLDKGAYQDAAVTVASETRSNPQGVPRKKCNGCGDCVTGCNFEAKNSLDVSLLVTARRRGACIYTGATVLHVTRDTGAGWVISVVHTDGKLRRRMAEPLALRATHVILAAGTFGSTEILMRSRDEGLPLSRKLGQRLSANGDGIAVAYDLEGGAHGSAREDQAPDQREVGPTISGLLDLRQGPLSNHVVVEDLGIPSPLRRLFEEVVTTAATLHGLQDADWKNHVRTRPGVEGPPDPLAVDRDRIDHSLVLATMGHDQSDGVLQFPDERSRGKKMERVDRCAFVSWPGLHSTGHPPFDAQVKRLEGLLGLDPDVPEAVPRAARLLPNPMWRPLPDKMDYLVEGRRGALMTVHPLGGCPMADDIEHGVVDADGRVFQPADPENPVYEGLFVLDGSIMPTSLGINPALTITAIALRAVGNLISKHGWMAAATSDAQLPSRPHFMAVNPSTKPDVEPTRVQVVERLSGPMSFTLDGQLVAHTVELTLRFHDIPIGDLSARMGRRLQVEDGKLRIFTEKLWNGFREMDDDEASFVGTVSGTLSVLDRETSWFGCRMARALPAWFLNRGARDAWQGIGLKNDGPIELIKDAFKLSTRAGERRRFEYDLTVTEGAAGSKKTPLDALLSRQLGAGRRRIRGFKRFTYARRSNPFHQLTDMTVTQFCALPRSFRGAASGPVVLTLDMPFLVRAGLPLLRITSQRSQPDALVDLTSLGLYLFRLLLAVHVWSARKPDVPAGRRLERLPGAVPGLPQPEFRWIDVEDAPDVYVDWKGPRSIRPRIRLTRYAGAAGSQPVLLIHGYSACGNTFAHPAVKPNLATALHDAGFDVWIVDLRSSIGVGMSEVPWRFEHMAYGDIPKAIGTISELTGQRVDVVAHCMGAAMLSMAVLRDTGTLPPYVSLLRRIVFLQVAPTMVFSPENIFRGYLMRYLFFYLGTQRYSTIVEPTQTLTDQLLDRLIAMLPYPKKDFDLENPAFWKKAPFVGTRHRLDLLFGRTFELGNMSPEVLDRIDDFFGAISTETIAQTIPFSQSNVVTTYDGSNEFVLAGRLAERFKNLKVLHLVGQQNGLMDPETSNSFKRQLGYAGLVEPDYQTDIVENLGHQDSLIGKGAGALFERIVAFLKAGGASS